MNEAPVTPDELRAHMQRVETMVSILSMLIGGLVENPMFSMMLTPDQKKELANL